MVSKIRSLGIAGIGGYEVSVECFLSNGLPAFDIVGLPDTAVKEARDRVRAAIKNAGLAFPVSRLTINLAPADMKKGGTTYDLPVLLSILICSGAIKPPGEDCAFFGELGLTGELRPVRGALPMAMAARRAGIRRLFVPADNAPEASFAEGLRVYPVKDLPALLRHFSGEEEIVPAVRPKLSDLPVPPADFAEVKGQENVKRALEVAAAGGHNLLIKFSSRIGKNHAGKTAENLEISTFLRMTSQAAKCMVHANQEL